jgi:hypothetical protein
VAPLDFPGSILTNARNPRDLYTIVGRKQTRMTMQYVGEYTCLRRTRQTVHTDDGIRDKLVNRMLGNGAIRGVEIIEKWIDPGAPGEAWVRRMLCRSQHD